VERHVPPSSPGTSPHLTRRRPKSGL
jgi:hypothetical protein